MTSATDRVSVLVATLASVRDDELATEASSPQARALLKTILDAPVDARPPDGSPRGASRARVFALSAAVIAAAVLVIPAFGVGSKIVSLFAGWRDPGAPVPTASDVVLSSGEAGVRWRIVATGSDQGLCLGLFHRAGGDAFGAASCGYTDIRGDLPVELRGDPASSCIATPTSVVPCGSLPSHWIALAGAGDSVGLERRFAFGPIAKDVARVDLLLSDGQTIRAHVVDEPGGLPLSFYWGGWSCPTRPVTEGPYAGLGLKECAETGPELQMAVARDSGGRMLERRVPAWNGNPTGDPEGPSPPTESAS